MFRALIFSLAMASIWFGIPLLPILVVSALFMTVAGTVFQPALQGIIPDLAEGHQVVKLGPVNIRIWNTDMAKIAHFGVEKACKRISPSRRFRF